MTTIAVPHRAQVLRTEFPHCTGRLAVTSDKFRLVLDGVPLAPEAAMAEVVAPNSAKEGEVVFVVPAAVTSAELRVGERNETATMPLDLQAARA